MSEHDVNTAGAPLTDEETNAVSGGDSESLVGYAAQRYKISIRCLKPNCRKTYIEYTQDPATYQTIMLRNGVYCPSCGNTDRTTLRLIIQTEN